MARGHKSTKIPGVRLRPAPAPAAGSSRSSDAQTASASSKRKRPEDDAEGEDLPVEAMNDVSRPFKGAIVCFSGLHDKAVLAQMAKELGASVESNLTDTVTHLVAADFASEKYRVALKLGFHIVSENWIWSSHSVWRDGGEVKLEESVKSHHLPIFRDLRICLSGFELGSLRTAFIKRIEEHKGYVSRTLDRSCTHLVTLSGSGEKVEWAQRSNHELTMAIVSGKPVRQVRYIETVTDGSGKPREVERVRDQTDIAIVWDWWVEDCLAAGGRWKEEDYSVEIPKSDVKRGVIQKASSTRALHAQDSTVLPVETSSAASTSALHKSVPSPLRRVPTEVSVTSTAATSITATTTADDLEPAVLKRLRRTASLLANGSVAADGDGHDVLMNEILGGVDLPLSQSSTRDKGKKRTLAVDADDSADGQIKATTTALASRTTASTSSTSFSRSQGSVAAMSRSKSFSSRQPSLPRPLSAASLHVDHPLLANAQVPSPIPEEVEPRSNESSLPSGNGQPFAGRRFLVRCGKGRTRREVSGAVQALGGALVSDDEQGWAQGADYVVVRLRGGRPQPILQLANWSTTTIVTQHWVENCFRADKLLLVDSSVVYRPLGISLPVPGATSIRLCPTKLDFNEQEFARVLIEAFGGEFVGGLTRSVTHLICSPKDVTGDKYTHAVEWGIPVLEPRWLADTARMGRFPEVDEYWLGDSRAKDSVDRSAKSLHLPLPLLSPHANADPQCPSPPPVAEFASQPVVRASLEVPPSASQATRAINRAVPSEAGLSSDPVKVASPSALGHMLAVSMPPAAPTSPVDRPLKARANSDESKTPHAPAWSKSDVLPVSAGRRASGGGKISPKPPAIAADVRAYIDQLEQEKRRVSPTAASTSGGFDERPVKRKRVLGRQGTMGTSTASPTTSTTSNNMLSGPPSPAAERQVLPPSSILHPNSPPGRSSDAAPSDDDHPGDQSLRVIYDDPDARAARQRMLDSLARGAAQARGEDVACIGAEFEAEVRRKEQEKESEALAKRLARRDVESGERRVSTRRTSNRA